MTVRIHIGKGAAWFALGFLLAYGWMLVRWNRADLAREYGWDDAEDAGQRMAKG